MGGDDRTTKLLEAGLALAADLSLDSLLQRIVDLAAELTGARYAALGVLGPDGDELVDFLTHGVTTEERAAIGPLPKGRGILGALIHDARLLRIDDIAKDPRSVGFPPNHPPMRSFLGAPVRSRGTVFGNIYLAEKEGAASFATEDEEVLRVLATQAGVAIENARLFEGAHQRELRLAAVAEITARILEGGSGEEILRLVVVRARELIGAATSCIVIPDAAGPDLVVRVASGEHAIDLEGLVVPRHSSVSGDVIDTGKAAVLDDPSQEARAYQPMFQAGRMGPSIFVPLAVRGQPFGTLTVANSSGGPRFAARHVDLVQAFADQASLGLEYTRAQAELGRLVLVEDRERIAKDLHDGVIQALFAVGLGLQGTAALVGDRRLAARLEEGVSEIDRVIGDLRSYIFGLRPEILAESRVTEALEQLAHDFEARTGIVAATDLDRGLDTALTEHAADLVQVAREALSNVGRHSHATTCRVTLHRVGDAAVLEIDDDGSGFALDGPRRMGMGLGNLRARVESLGGELSIESVEGEGTTLSVRLPL